MSINLPDEPENEPWEDGTEAECDHCHRIRICQSWPDPFSSEVWPEDGPYEATWWCHTCYMERHDEV